MLRLGRMISCVIDDRAVLPAAMVHSLVVVEAGFTPFGLNTILDFFWGWGVFFAVCENVMGILRSHLFKLIFLVYC